MGARPSTFKRGGGGFLSDVDATITGYEFTTEFPGATQARKKSDFRSLFAVLSARVDGAEEDVQTTLFAGGADDFTISDDGLTLTPVEDNGGIGGNTGWGKLITSMVAAGFDENLLPEDAINFEAIIGQRVRFVQKVDAETTARLGKRKGKNGKEYNRTDLLIEAVYGKAVAAKPAAKAAAKATGKAPKSNGHAVAADVEAAGDLTEFADETLMAIIAASNGKPLPKAKLSVKILQTLGKDPRRQDVYTLMYDDAFLARENGWNYDAQTQTLSL